MQSITQKADQRQDIRMELSLLKQLASTTLEKYALQLLETAMPDGTVEEGSLIISLSPTAPGKWTVRATIIGKRT